MKDRENKKWSMKNIAHQYKLENPDWTWKECWNKAKVIYKELNNMNANMFNNTDRFFKFNTPFSFYDNKDGEFADLPWDGN